MAFVSVRINEESIRAKILAAAELKSYPVAYKRAQSIFKRAYGRLLKDFDQHPVTIEIRAGPSDTVNISNTLGGYGNLFAYIGFDENSDPIEPLRNLLIDSTILGKGSFRSGGWNFRISLPSREAIDNVTPMPWEHGNSWVEGVEHGMSNLSYFLNKQAAKSRSGYGIQVPDEVNQSLSFERVSYITEILANFRNRVRNSKNNDI